MDILEQCKRIYVTDYIVYTQYLTQTSITRAKICVNTLRAPQSKLVTVSKLMTREMNEFAVKKWGIACGEIVVLTRKAADKIMLDEVGRLYNISVSQGMKLFKYFDGNKKVKFVLYLFSYPVFRTISRLRLVVNK